MLQTKLSESAVFKAACELAPSERAAYLEVACGNNVDLRQEVESLLAAHDPQDQFLAGPAVTIDQPLAERAGTVVGRYKLLQQIGAGGFGVVFMAEQQEPVRRTVALKIVKAGMDTAEVIARFEAERQALALMDHPNIAKVLDAGATPSGRPFFVMELVKGVPITEFCDRNYMPAEGRLKLFLDICHAIQHAHHKGVIHRDVKPSNVLVTLHDGVPVVKVIDFGVAKATAAKLTEKTLFTAFGQMVGTPAYMSPEQAEMSGLDIDTRSDIYSLGVLLYELLTGTTPLEQQRLRQAGYAEMQRLIREEEAPRPSNRLSSLGDSATVLAGNRGTDPKQLSRLLAGDLDWIVMKALDKDRNRRYSTPGNFAEDIDRYLRREAILARPPTAAYRVRKFIQRNRAATLTTAAIATAMVVGCGLATWQAIAATRARQDALVALEHKEQARAAEAEQRRLAEASEQRAKSAEQTAKREEQRAKASEAESQAVLEFVESNIIAAARPDGQEGGLGQQVTLRQALEAALPYVEKNFKNQPLIEARLRMTLGQSFRYLGERKIALAQFERAHALNMQHRPDSHETLACMLSLCMVYQHLGMGEEGVKLAEETVQRMTAKLGPDHRDTLRAMSSLAKLYATLRRLEDAYQLHKQTLERQTALFGPDDEDTLLTQMDLGTDLAWMHRVDEELQVREDSLARLTAKFGEGHPQTLNAMGGLSYTYAGLGRHEEALKLREQALAFLIEKFPLDHPLTVAGMRNLARSYDIANRGPEALRLREDAFALEQANLGKDDATTLASAATLAKNFSSLKQHQKAIVLGEETVQLLKTKLGESDPATLRSMVRLAVIYNTAGRRADAQKLCAAVVETQRVTLGSDDDDTLESMRVWSDTHTGEDQLRIRQEALALVQAKHGPDHPDTLAWMRSVAFSLQSLDRGSELVAICDEYVQRVGENPKDVEGFRIMLFLRIRGFIKLGDPSGCRSTAEMWERLKLTSTYGYYNAAAMRARTADVIRKTDESQQGAQQADAEADRAMDWLNQAVASGFKDFAHAENANDFASLRGRDDFKKLIADLKASQPQGIPKDQPN